MEETTTTPSSISQDIKPVNNNAIMGVLCYLGILVIVPILAAKDVPFVKFHIKQGLILAVGEVAVWVLSLFAWNIVGGLWFMVSNLLNLGFLIFSVLGIINTIQNKEQPLPYIGHLAKNFDSYLK